MSFLKSSHMEDLFLLLDLLRYNLKYHEYPLLLSFISVTFSILPTLCKYHHHLILGHFHHPQKKYILLYLTSFTKHNVFEVHLWFFEDFFRAVNY